MKTLYKDPAERLMNKWGSALYSRDCPKVMIISDTSTYRVCQYAANVVGLQLPNGKIRIVKDRTCKCLNHEFTIEEFTEKFFVDLL